MRQRFEEFEERDDSLGLVGEERLDEFARPQRRLPAAALTVFVMAVFAGGLWFAYHEGTRHAAPTAQGDAVPLLRADDRPTKVKPDQPGGMPVPDQNVSVYNDKPGAAVEKLLPPPEQPLPRPAPSAKETGSPTPAAPGLAGTAASSQPAAATPTAPQQQSAAGAAAKPATKPAAKATPAAVSTPLKSEAKTPPAASKTGSARVQLGALRSPEAARDEWARLKREHPELLGKLTAVAVRADLGDKGIFYRIQTQPLADAAAAERLCADLKKQKVGCSLAR